MKLQTNPDGKLLSRTNSKIEKILVKDHQSVNKNQVMMVLQSAADYKDILAHRERINQIIYDELMEIQKRFGDERRTELQVGDITNIEDEDLIEEEDIIVALTHNGYIKRLPVDEFKSQHRGGRGVLQRG